MKKNEIINMCGGDFLIQLCADVPHRQVFSIKLFKSVGLWDFALLILLATKALVLLSTHEQGFVYPNYRSTKQVSVPELSGHREK